MIKLEEGSEVLASTHDEIETLLKHAESFQQKPTPSMPECGKKQELDWLFETSVTHNSLPFVFLTHR